MSRVVFSLRAFLLLAVFIGGTFFALFGISCNDYGNHGHELMVEPAITLSDSSVDRPVNIEQYVEPTLPLIRKTAITALQQCPLSVEMNSDTWKIWQLNRWVSVSIDYVSDPLANNYFAYAHETLEIGAGDCDDFAILLCSLYESVGLDAAIACVDTDGDLQTDHMACLVYYGEDGESFIDSERAILDSLGMDTDVRIICFDQANSNLMPAKYDGGIWVVADPTMAIVKEKVAYIAHRPYQAIAVVDVGG